MTRITEEEVKKLYIENNTPERVKRHCKAVSDAAVKVAEELNKAGLSLDISLIKGAALAHDVCRVKENHGEVCAKILEKKGFVDEAKIVKVHMFHDFNPFDKLNETDMVCLGDRIVKEDQYVGIDERINYIINKVEGCPERTARILEKKKDINKFVSKVEEKIGQPIDNLFKKG